MNNLTVASSMQAFPEKKNSIGSKEQGNRNNSCAGSKVTSAGVRHGISEGNPGNGPVLDPVITPTSWSKTRDRFTVFF